MSNVPRVTKAIISGLVRDWRAASVVVTVLALGYGVALGTGRVVAPVFLPSSALARPAELHRVQGMEHGRPVRVAFPIFRDYAAQARAFSGLAASLDSLPFDLSTGRDNAVRRVLGAAVTGGYFDLLGVRPQLGRLLSPSDDSLSAASVVVLSHSTWKSHFAGGADVVGRMVRVNGHAVEVIGVAPQSFRGLSVEQRPALWVPIALAGRIDPILAKAGILECSECRSFEVVGRLPDGLGPAAAESQLQAIDSALGLGPNQPTPRVVTLAGGVNAETRRIARLILILAAVFFAIASVDAAGILIAREGRRRRDSAVRRSLGAPLGEIVLRSVVEAALLSAGAAIGAVLLASWIGAVLVPTALAGLPLAGEDAPAAIDPGVLLGFAGAALAWGGTLGFLSAPRVKDTGLSTALRRGEVLLGIHPMRLRTALLVAQIALTVCLVIQGGLLIRTLHEVVSRDLGFDPGRVVVASVDVSRRGLSGDASLRVLDGLLDDARRLPEATAAALTGGTPFGGYQTAPMVLDGRSEPVIVDLAMISPGYFRTLGIPLLRGREISERDTTSTTVVAVIDAHAAKRYWPGQDPIGKTIASLGPARNVTIVGLAGSVVKRTRAESPCTVHVALKQFYEAFPWQPRVQVAARSASASGATAIAGALRELQPGAPLFDVRTLREQQLLEFRREDALRGLLSLLGALAILLSAAGIYGIVAYTAEARVHEFGIRAAIGARPAELARRVLAHGAGVAALGGALGMLGAVVVGRAMSVLLFGVSAFDGVTYLGSATLILVVTLLASAAPAVRAMRPNLSLLLRGD